MFDTIRRALCRLLCEHKLRTTVFAAPESLLPPGHPNDPRVGDRVQTTQEFRSWWVRTGTVTHVWPRWHSDAVVRVDWDDRDRVSGGAMIAAGWLEKEARYAVD